MFLIYLPDGSNVHGARRGEFEGIWSAKGLKVVKIVPCEGTSYLLVQTL